jgi:hypothetical protein
MLVASTLCSSWLWSCPGGSTGAEQLREEPPQHSQAANDAQPEHRNQVEQPMFSRCHTEAKPPMEGSKNTFRG